MNKVTKNLFQYIYPFYPLWAWLVVTFLHQPIEKVFIYVLLPSLFYVIYFVRLKIPAYLGFFIAFTIYHIGSSFYFHIVPPGTKWYLFILTDPNILACVILFVVEHTNFDEDFIKKMTRHILWIVILSLVVSVIQMKKPLFFYNTGVDEELDFLGDNRKSSIFSWVSLNSIGITFPILISILLNYYKTNSRPFPLVTLSGIVVSFLSKARYVMISTIIAFMQLLLVSTIPLKKKLSFVLYFAIGIFVIIGASKMVGYDINATINERILEKDTDMHSAKARIASYDVFMLKFPENPYFGVGPKTRPDVVDLLSGEAPIIHVGYLSYLYFYGAFGASLLFIALILLLREAWLVGRRYEFWGSFYGLIGFAIANFLLVFFNFTEMGIILAVIYIRYYNISMTVKE